MSDFQDPLSPPLEGVCAVPGGYGKLSREAKLVMWLEHKLAESLDETKFQVALT